MSREYRDMHTGRKTLIIYIGLLEGERILKVFYVILMGESSYYKPFKPPILSISYIQNERFHNSFAFPSAIKINGVMRARPGLGRRTSRTLTPTDQYCSL